MKRVLRLSLCCLALSSAPALTQAAPSAQTVGIEAAHALRQHLYLIPNTPAPKTGQTLAGGHWSIANQPPAQCAGVPAGSGPCVRLIYSVPDAGVSCEWSVLLNADATDVTFLDENDDAAHYFMPLLSTAALSGLVANKSMPTYPPIAVAAHVEGDVKLYAIVGVDGKPSRVMQIGGAPMLTQTAIDACDLWQFRPLQIGDRTVPFVTMVLFHFSNPRMDTSTFKTTFTGSVTSTP
jgi:hypothetical protein